eukprot:CAMPEP_0185761932 /NCGR_PEP_ID=MMETSP1174-20130828/20887_1 /TAXON_ID=35687 /ORGANISM="Dictyocha speculum, Strain CCMP1381" /LENGTH=367 /DNA_ID=CAMNT_0028443381 /DNA_START=9 /DNA_END=1112 /DNA_ORIENTATION=+
MLHSPKHRCFVVMKVFVLAALGTIRAEDNIITRPTFENHRAGAILSLEHANLNVPSWTSELENFWVTALGAVSDPRSAAVFKRTKDNNGTLEGLNWINIGLQQFHMPFEAPTQSIPGYVGLTFPDLDDLQVRLSGAGVQWVKHSKARDQEIGGYDRDRPWSEDFLSVQSPTGVNLRLHESSPTRSNPMAWYGPSLHLLPTNRELALPGGQSMGSGIVYLAFRARIGTAGTICEFYEAALDAQTSLRDHVCEVFIGMEQALLFFESEIETTYDGHHIAIYVNAFSDLYTRAKTLNLVWDNPRYPQFTYPTLEDAVRHKEFRILNIMNLTSGRVVHTLEHEIRSVEHPGFSCRSLLPAMDPRRLSEQEL